jgi:hypothetical protein
MAGTDKKDEAKIVKFPGIASISLSITPIEELADLKMFEAIVRVYDDNDEQIMQQKARSLFTIAKNLKLFIQTRTNLPINDRRMSTWLTDYLTDIGVKIEDEEDVYQIIKEASQTLKRIPRATIELVEPSDLVSIETDVTAKIIELQSEHLLSEEEVDDLLEKHQTPVSNSIQRTMSYVNNGGVEHSDTINLEITPAEQIFDHKLTTSFKNETEHKLQKIKISDVIPFCYKVKEVTSKKGGKYKKKLLENGLQLTWTIDSLPPGEAIFTHYSLEKRIPRTILIRKGEEIRIVQDYNKVMIEGDEEEGEIKRVVISELINLLPVILDELIVRDLFPHELRADQEDIAEDVRLIDFGTKYGLNIQWSMMNVETGTKLLKKYNVHSAPLVWKSDLKVPIGEEGISNVLVTKILEPMQNKNQQICTIVASSPVPCEVIYDLETGLKATEFSPSDCEPTIKGQQLIWSVDNRLEVSMVLSGRLNREPTPPKVKIDGTIHTSPAAEGTHIRTSKVISIPFTHVALYRRNMR